MEIGLREWMIIIGGVLIIAVLADGVRRMLRDRKDSIRYSRRARHPLLSPEVEEDLSRNPELPSGRARVKPRDEFDVPPLAADEHAAEDEPGLPVLMDAVDAPAGQSPRTKDEPAAPVRPTQEELFGVPEVEEEPEEHGAEEEQVSDVIVINVMAGTGDMIAGKRLLESLLACDLRFGEMDIFHRFSRDRKRGNRKLFSVANLVKPGTFDVDRMDEFSTPGISMFMPLPGPPDPQDAFRLMLDTARALAQELGAELYDDQHCKLRPQALEHMRERIVEFERKRLARS